MLIYLIMSASLLYAADFGYQGTHILTHGALEDVARAFEKKYGMHVTVKGGGCADGIAVVAKDRYEMGGLCCPLSPETAKKYGMTAHRVAVDIKAVIVNPKNSIKNLTMQQVSDIHKGTITGWKQVGGSHKPVALVFRDHCRDMDEPVRKALSIKGDISKKAIIVKTDQEIIENVEKFPSAIGVVSRVLAEKAKVKIIDVDEVSPTPRNVEKKLYPITGDLYIVTKGMPEWSDRLWKD
ncbi:MAG: substrate-binding domain-containing protein [Nitrospirae bacterium]|nr:substrate-binding domain-containing protein [Nitrospirota bacterium]